MRPQLEVTVIFYSFGLALQGLPATGPRRHLQSEVVKSGQTAIQFGQRAQVCGTSSRSLPHQQWRRNEFERGVGEGTGPERKWGVPIWREAPEIFLVVLLHFLALKAILVVLVSAFVMVSTFWSVSCLLFFYSRCPRAQSFVKVGARAPVPHGVGTTAHQHTYTLSPVYTGPSPLDSFYRCYDGPDN